MKRCILVVPTGSGVGLTSISLGITRALDRRGVNAAFIRPIRVRRGADPSGEVLQRVAGRVPPASIDRAEAESLLATDPAVLLERVVSMVEEAGRETDLVVVEGCVPVAGVAYATRLNVDLAQALDAELVVVGVPEGAGPLQAARWFDVATRPYGDRAASCIVNRVRLPEAEQPRTPILPRTTRMVPEDMLAAWTDAFRNADLNLVGLVPHLELLSQPRVADVARVLNASTLVAGDLGRRVAQVSVCAASLRSVLATVGPGTLAVVPADRDDVLVGLSLATLAGQELAGIVVSLDLPPDPAILAQCAPAFETGLPVLASGLDSYPTAMRIHELAVELGPEDAPLAELSLDVVANHLRTAWLLERASSAPARRMTTAAFRYALITRARQANRRIVLPEGEEPRTLQAAAICARRGIARPVLLGNPAAVHRAARTAGVELSEAVEVLDPRKLIDSYVDGMVRRRAHKGLTPGQARDRLGDRVTLGTMMVAEGDCDGLVSGAVHSTAHTIRPALQLIRTSPGTSLVSSAFFMCLPEQVLVYGDCAVNPDPSAQQLAEIAVQCADSAAAFGIEPRVGMISYSTHGSGAGHGVEKVEDATRIAQSMRPDLLIDGPLQYDAAAIASVGASKAPDSAVAGRATVFVFPDLNTGNTTYKAVQRSANVVSMGPLLQGLARPVNDLSRGATVEDIVFTIALTAVQSAQLEG
jgi:phosphate acetyltransferase